MTQLKQFIASLDWEMISNHLDQEGFAVLPGLLDESSIQAFKEMLDGSNNNDHLSLEVLGIGRGELILLPDVPGSILNLLKEALFGHLVPIANRWCETLGGESRYPESLREFQEQNRRAGQTKSQSSLTVLRDRDHIGLHQLTEGIHVFPLQVVALLSKPHDDFEGGEFVMSEQRPRMQSRPIVVPMTQGDAAIISVSQRPFRGSKGHYRVNMKHAVSRVREGTRLGLDLLFHDVH